MRYFIKLQYDGSRHHGWQAQLTDVPTIQGDIEDAIYTITRQKISVVGCGRTDTGVHARDYYMHLDLPEGMDDKLFGRINKYLPDTIALLHYKEVDSEAHARFDAISRSYEYHIHFNKDPFLIDKSYHYPYNDLDFDLLQDAVSMLTEFSHFDTFCKTHTDVKEKNCTITHSKWIIQDDKAVYHVSANRFLRGMIRLIVGMSLQVARGKLNLDYVINQISNQAPLIKALSAPAHGLYLCDIKYPYDVDILA